MAGVDTPGAPGTVSSSVRLAGPLGVLALAALVISLVEGAPEALPGVALGSSVLLHAERAAALFAIVVATVTVLVQASRGRLPSQLSTAGLVYDAETTAQVSVAVAGLQEQVEELQRTVDAIVQELADERPPR
jgi:hypothetical protein